MLVNRLIRGLPRLIALLGVTGVLTAAQDRSAGNRIAALNLDIGSLSPGDSIVITFAVDIDSFPPFENGTYDLSARGMVTGDNFADVLTDDPDTVQDDATMTTVHESPVVAVVVTQLNAASTEAGVALSWTLSADALTELRGVLVQRAASAPGPYVTITPSPISPAVGGTMIDNDVEAGASYWYRLALVELDGTRIFSGSVDVRFEGFKLRTQLHTPVVARGKPIEVLYTIGTTNKTHVKLEVFNVAGQRVRVLEEGMRGPGRHRATWDRSSQSGRVVAHGIYIVRLTANGQTFSRKTVILH